MLEVLKRNKFPALIVTVWLVYAVCFLVLAFRNGVAFDALCHIFMLGYPPFLFGRVVAFEKAMRIVDAAVEEERGEL